MALFSGFGVSNTFYKVVADDKEQALDLIFDMVKEDFPDADSYEVVNLAEEVK